MKRRFRSFGVVALLFALGCGTAGAPVEIASGKPLPASSAQALSLKTSGAAWSNAEIRAHYLALAAAIGPADAELKRRGVPAEERAHRAFQTRHDARVTCRAMMADAREVTALNHRSRFSNNTHASLEPRAPASGPFSDSPPCWRAGLGSACWRARFQALCCCGIVIGHLEQRDQEKYGHHDGPRFGTPRILNELNERLALSPPPSFGRGGAGLAFSGVNR